VRLNRISALSLKVSEIIAANCSIDTLRSDSDSLRAKLESIVAAHEVPQKNMETKLEHELAEAVDMLHEDKNGTQQQLDEERYEHDTADDEVDDTDIGISFSLVACAKTVVTDDASSVCEGSFDMNSSAGELGIVRSCS
jgi:hypothetical protein